MAEEKNTAEDKNTLVHVEFKRFPELLKGLDEMVEEDDSDRSKVIRNLVRQEIARRAALKSPPPLPKQPRRKNNQAAQMVAVAG